MFYKNETRPIGDLIPYVNNSRIHSDDQINQIVSSMREWGFTNPVLVDEENSIIAGHGRVAAAKKLSIDEIPCVILEGLTEAQKKAYVIADNKLALNAGWDEELLAVEIEGLKDLDFELGLLGFDEDELANILGDGIVEGLTDEDAVPEIPDEPITKEGDIWILGNHRLMCGDSTSIDAVERLMDGQKADMVFTDPPYGMSYGGGRAAGSTPKGARVKAHGEIIGDALRGDELLQMVSDAITSTVMVQKEGAASYICFTWRTYAEFEDALNAAGLDVKACIVWDKKSIGLGYSQYRPQHEFIFYCGQKMQPNAQWHGQNNESDVWYMSRGATGEYVHPTQKPVELVERAIKNSSKAGDMVLDVFAGSGSTVIAGEKTGRHVRAMELDPKYCDVIVKRWQDFTGKEAANESGGIFNG